MKKIAIISSCSLPIPAIKGGAVETLIENIVKENENLKKIDLYIISIYDKEASLQSNKYKYSKFVYFKKNWIIKQSDLVITQILKKIKRDRTISSRNYLWKLLVLKKLSKHLRENNYDYIIIENTVYLFNVLKNDYIREKYKDKYFFHVHNNLVKKGCKEVVLKCRKFIAISNYIKENIVNVLGTDISDKVSILHNGINTDLFNRSLSCEEKTNLLNNLGIDDNKKILLFAGRITPEKGIKEVLQAFKKIDREDLILLIIGSSYFGNGTSSEFENEVITLVNGMKEKIVFTGYINNEEIWKYYKLASVAVLPSMWDEPLGLTMIEAKCSGIPVITTNSGGIPETIKNGQGIILKRDENIVENIAKSIEQILDNMDIWKEKINEAKIEALMENSLENYYNGFINILMN
ncbi:glycosyltransferase family 4 protein [Clostridium nigeriense]|uniref:glycosyltransferase family 4 protein n=1 Tax=Clostridium nigeriense TaxID=1805470 RepID=UPI003D3307A5